MSRLLICLESRCAEAFVRTALDGRGYVMTVVPSVNDMIETVRRNDFDFILMDANFTEMSAIAAIRLLRNMGSEAQIIIGSTESDNLMQQLFLTSVGADEVRPFRKAVEFLADCGKYFPPISGNVVAFRANAIR